MVKNSTRPTAVVTELSIAGLSIIRSLGKKGVRVIGVDSDLSKYGALSKYCKTVFCKNVNDYSLVEMLIDIGKTFNQKAILFPASDLSVSVVSAYRVELEKFFSFNLPSNEVIEILANKRLFHEFALKNGFSIPNTIFTHGATDVEKAGNTTSYPCVIKPEFRDDYWYNHVPHKDKVLFVSSINEYFELFTKYDISNRPLIIQEWIHGDDTDVYFVLTYLDKNSHPLAIFTGKKIRQHPILTGVTSAGTSMWVPYIAEEGLKLLKLAGCKGLCSVEFKFCHKDNIFKITEPTVGRPDNQESMSTAAGLDIPYIAYLDSAGISKKSLHHFKDGVKWYCEPNEIYSIPAHFRKGEYSLKQLLTSFSGKRSYALMDIKDPFPFLFFLKRTLKQQIIRIFRKKLSRTEF
jgi:predicted ATP-grasp superfamily ATP-dependent carboligase